MKAERAAAGIDVFLGLGSNLQQPREQVYRAFEALRRLPSSQAAVCSPLYRSPPMGPADQPDYVNAVVRLRSTLSAEQLLRETQRIEHDQGRVRSRRWGARSLDIDLLLYGDRVIDTPELQIPHPGIRERLFVLRPLLDLAPDTIVPGQGAAAELAADLLRVGNPQIERLS